MQDRLHLAIGFCVIAAVGIALFIETAHFVRLSTFFLQLLPTSDSQLYLAMGRGWLNGLAFYRDLFETKPPLVFLIAALTLWLNGGYVLFVSLQLALLLLLPAFLAVTSYKTLNRSLGRVRWIVIALSLLLGLTIAVATLSRTYGYQTEGFALFFSTLPAVLLAWPTSHRRRLLVDLAAGASLACAAMLKEPFVGSALLAMVIVCRSKNDAFRIIRILIVGGLLSLAILLVSGSLWDYFSLYLWEIFHGRSVAAVMYPDYGQRIYYIIPSPLWSRTLNVYKLFADLGTPVSSMVLSLFFAACFCLWPALGRGGIAVKPAAVSAIAFFTVIVAGHYMFQFQQLIAGLQATGHPGIPWQNPIILRLLAMGCGLPIAMVVALFVWRRWYSPPVDSIFGSPSRPRSHWRPRLWSNGDNR